MTEAAAPTERVRPDQALPITPARAAVLQEACAVAAAIHSALDLGVIARVTEAPAEPAAVAADCGLTQQGAQVLLSALAGLDLLELGDDGCFRPVSSNLAELAELLVGVPPAGTAWRKSAGGRSGDRGSGVSLSETRGAVRGALPPERRARAAGLLVQPRLQVLDVGAGAAP